MDRPSKSARQSAMDLLARRGHSESELIAKLARKYPQEEAEEAARFARDSGWLTPPAEHAERVATELGNKRRGHQYISSYLAAKGLPPPPPPDPEDELRKAREFAESKLAHPYPYDYEEQKKLSRWLSSRGFDEETIRRVFEP